MRVETNVPETLRDRLFSFDGRLEKIDQRLHLEKVQNKQFKALLGRLIQQVWAAFKRWVRDPLVEIFNSEISDQIVKEYTEIRTELEGLRVSIEAFTGVVVKFKLRIDRPEKEGCQRRAKMNSLEIVEKAVSWIGDQFKIVEQLTEDLKGHPISKRVSATQKKVLDSIEGQFNTSRDSIETGFWRLQNFILDYEDQVSNAGAGDHHQRAKIERETKEAADEMERIFPGMNARLKNMQRMFDGKSYVHY